MAITTYSELQAAIVSWSHRDDLTTANKQEFIALAEADLQVRAKLTQWDTTATITVTAGSGPLPADFASLRYVRWGTEPNTLNQVSPAKYGFLVAATDPSTPINYAIIGDTLRIVPTATGSAYATYVARFVALSDGFPTNSLLTLFPDAYLWGAMAQFCIWSEDDSGIAKYTAMYGGAVDRVKQYTSARRYGDSPLVMRIG